MKNNTFLTFILMHFGFLLYSFYTVLGKIAAKYNSFSTKWCIYYCLIICLLALYAILWQQVLKKITLSVAICNKAITIVWGMTFSHFLFNEEITLKKIIAVCVILAGIILLSISDNKESEEML